jgi:hypothetical protein
MAGFLVFKYKTSFPTSTSSVKMRALVAKYKTTFFAILAELWGGLWVQTRCCDVTVLVY